MHKLARQTHTPHTHATRDQTQNRTHVYLTSFGEIILELYRVLLAADLPDTPRVTDAASATDCAALGEDAPPDIGPALMAKDCAGTNRAAGAYYWGKISPQTLAVASRLPPG